MNCYLYFVVICILLSICKCDETKEVRIKQGVLVGKIKTTLFKKDKYYAFRGIPYALPPVESLRFKPPVPHNGWEETYKAYKKQPTCYQYNSRSRNGEEIGISGSEDCLYLSVFSSNLEGSAPVLVFDYNDNFRSGFNGTDVYSPDFFIEEDVIVVTINHRLGLFGYITTNDDVIPPNAGLKDFILGLKWIKDNIREFGGDPNRVTLMGNQGGAILTDILLYSEKAKGLFDAVIIHGGTALESTLFDKDPREKAFTLAKALEIEVTDSESLLKELQKIDGETLISKDGEAVDNSLLDKYQISIYPFSPTIEEKSEDAVITALPEEARIVNDVPVMIGMNSRPGLDLASHYIIEPRLVAEMAQDFFMMFPIRSSFAFDRNSSIYEQVIKNIKNFYFDEGLFYYGNVLEYAVYSGDILQNYALNYAAKKLSKSLNSSVFYYMFDYRGLLNENSEYLARNARATIKHWGATITDDLCYLFLCKRIRKTYEQLNKLVSEQPEIKVLKKMVRLWTNFIKTRNPTPPEDDLLNNLQWEALNKDNKDAYYLHITKVFKMKRNPLGKRENFWDTFFDKYSKLAVDGVVVNTNESHDEL